MTCNEAGTNINHCSQSIVSMARALSYLSHTALTL